MRAPAGHWIWPALLLVAGLAGCSTRYYRNSADRAAYSAIRQKTPAVPNMDPHFTITQTNGISLDPYPVSTNVEPYLGEEGERERGAHRLNLADSLKIAVLHSRDYQNHKEDLYLSALGLTLARHQFAPIFSAGASGTYSSDRVDEQLVVVSGSATNTIDQVVDQDQISGSGNIGVSWLIRDLGKITAAFEADALRVITGNPGVITKSQLSATFLSPLWRDARFKSQREALIQAERNLLYSVRTFTQYRKDFSVRIATDYYGILGDRDAVRNSYLNLESSKKNAERTRALAAEGRATSVDLGRLEQQELSAESSWINAVRRYQQDLDDFKLTLGLDVTTKVVLDDHELEELEIHHPDISVEDSIRVALEGRLDYQTAKDQFDNAEREVKLDANLLKPQLDFSAAVNVPTSSGSGNFNLPDPSHYSWDAGLDFDPGLDRTSERNTYRRALIARDRADRDLDQLKDQIILQVRDSWRTLDQAKRNYEISQISVRLAERRVEEQDLLAEVGRARAQDQVDAQNALIDSKNQLTQALVTHTIARLQFWNRMGILFIKDNGQWKEMQSAQAK